jgi:6-phosphogluconolactonase
MDVVKVFSSTDEIAAAARAYVLKAAADSIADHGVFNIALSGGSTPKKLYELLAEQKDVEWQKWHFFMGDERFVPRDDERSNQHQANTTLLAKIPVDSSQIHAVPVDQPTVEQAAELYENHLWNYFGSSSGEPPAFDLILLGLGSDGHTASLFPGQPALDETKRLVVASPPGILPPPVDRVTFTLPLINAGRRVLFMVTGADKAETFQAVQRDLTNNPENAATPAGKVRPVSGELLYFVDQAIVGTSQD